MKTKINQVALALFFTLILLGGKVNAKGTEFIASSLETIEDQELTVEDWMIDGNYWETSDVLFFIDEVTEENLEMEYWMVNRKAWGNERFNFRTKEVDKNLDVESWMISENIWNRQ